MNFGDNWILWHLRLKVYHALKRIFGNPGYFNVNYTYREWFEGLILILVYNVEQPALIFFTDFFFNKQLTNIQSWHNEIVADYVLWFTSAK